MNDTISSLVVSAVVFGGLYLALKFLKAKQIQQENLMLKAYMESLQKFCGEIQQRIEATRRYRHDLKGYIMTLEAMVGTVDQNETIRNYLEEQNKKHTELRTLAYGTDEFISTIIELKKEECENKGIPTDFYVKEGDYSGIEEIDKVCLLINLLDNAIEATERLKADDPPKIKLQIEVCDGQMKIHLENGLIKGEAFSFRTRKSDKRNHGLGTAIIMQVIDKYNGTRNTTADKESGILRDDMTLCLSKKEVS